MVASCNSMVEGLMKYVLMTMVILATLAASWVIGVNVGHDYGYRVGYAAGRSACPPVVAPPIGKAPWQ